MARFGSKLPARPVRREEEHSQHQDPGHGHPQGVPVFPDPLPGSHHYDTKTATPVEHQLDVGPADPYYGKGGMAHGVPAPVHHGGRPTARPEDRGEAAASRKLVDAETRTRPDPVPVYIVQPGGGNRPLARAALQQRIVPAPGADPVVLVPRDPRRSSIRLLNESASPVRLLFDLALSGGALLPANMASYLEIDTEDEICAYVPAGAAAQSISAHGAVTSPTALQVIAATPTLTGIYQVTVTVYIDGTPSAATDDDNMETAGALTAQLAVPAGTPQAVTSTFTIAFANSGLSVKAIGAGTSGAVYHALIIATPQTVQPAAAAAAVSVISQYDVPSGG